jgi:hypothetical protein
VDGESSHSGTSAGLDTISSHLAVRVLRNSLAGDPFSSIAVGSGWCSAGTLWADAERPGDGRQRGNHASDRDALHSATREPDVARCDTEHAATIFGRSGAARTVQRRRSGDAVRRHPYYFDLPASSRQDGERTGSHIAEILQDATLDSLTVKREVKSRRET